MQEWFPVIVIAQESVNFVIDLHNQVNKRSTGVPKNAFESEKISYRRHTMNALVKKTAIKRRQSSTGVPCLVNLGYEKGDLSLEQHHGKERGRELTDFDTVQSSSCFSPPPTRSGAAMLTPSWG
jgi:hypothetical protein